MGLEHLEKAAEINLTEDRASCRMPLLEVPHLEGIKHPDGQFMEQEMNDSEREANELPGILEKKTEDAELASGMEQQAEKIKDVYDSMPELQFENWKKLDLEERTKVLETFEQKIAEIEKRAPMPVRCEMTRPGLMGYNDGSKLVISYQLVGSDQFSNYKEMLNTLFHEGRHSYQNHNLYISRTEKSDELYNSWVVNREKLGYSSSTTSFPFNLSNSFRERGYYKYYTQPVEVDARLFAETVVDKIGLKEG